jgi:hypothetical protein
MNQPRGTARIAAIAVAIGVLLALVSPTATLRADDPGCKCNDDGYGQYKCNAEQTACIPGGQVCDLQCRE